MIQVLLRAMRILDHLGENARRDCPLTEIADALSLDKGTCANILKTLSCGGFVQQEAPRSGYRLGYRLFHLTGHQVENEELTKIARHDIDLLGEYLNETALLSMARNDKRILLYNTTPKRDIEVRTSIDKSLFNACSGRAIIANYTSPHLDKLLIRIGLPSQNEWPEIYEDGKPEIYEDGKPKRSLLINELIQIRQQGYAVQHDENGIVGYAAPIWRDGHVVGSVGVYMPFYRLKDEDMVIKALLRCANDINQKIALSLDA